MFLLLDNYDSFTYNLRHYLGELGAKRDTFSFDYEEEFIEMCLELTRFAAGLAAAPDAFEIRFTEYY